MDRFLEVREKYSEIAQSGNVADTEARCIVKELVDLQTKLTIEDREEILKRLGQFY